MEKISFITVKKTKRVIVRNPVTVYQKVKSGARKGKTKTRQIRYCPDLDSIYVDEQRQLADKPEQEPVYIMKGIISVDSQMSNLLEFMRQHPDNVANGGSQFKELDIAKEEKFEIEKFEALDKARRAIMESDENTLRSIAAWFLGVNYIKKTKERLKIILRTKCENEPDFVRNLNEYVASDSNDEKLMITLALTEEIIFIKDGKRVAWKDSGHPIYLASQPQDVIVDFANWLRTDEEGRATLKIMVDKIDALKK